MVDIRNALIELFAELLLSAIVFCISAGFTLIPRPTMIFAFALDFTTAVIIAIGLAFIAMAAMTTVRLWKLIKPSSTDGP